MKKLIAMIPDDMLIPSEFIAQCVEFKIETVSQTGKSPRSRRVVPGKTCTKVILEHFTPQGMFTRSIAQGWLTQHGYAETSVNSALHQLTKDGCVRKISHDRYQFLNGRDHA